MTKKLLEVRDTHLYFFFEGNGDIFRWVKIPSTITMINEQDDKPFHPSLRYSKEMHTKGAYSANKLGV